MRWTRLAASVAVSFAIVLLLGSVARSAEQAPAAGADTGAAKAVPAWNEPPPKPDAGPGRSPDRRGPFGLVPSGPGDRPGRPDRVGPPSDRPDDRPGRPDRIGPPSKRPGPLRERPGPPAARSGDRPGPPPQGGPGHPGGPPRWPHRNWDSLEKSDPEMYKLLKADDDLERETRELAMQYRRAPGDQRAAIKKEMQGTVKKHFEVRQQRRQLELQRLEEELERLSTALKNRSEAQQEIVNQRVKQLLGENDLEF